MRTYTKFLMLGFSVVLILCSCSQGEDVDELYLRASEAKGGVDDAINAVLDLAESDDESASMRLLQIALGDTVFVSPHIQSAAIMAVAGRDIERVDVLLATQLIPSNALFTRQTVSASLLKTGCTKDCLRLVLHYLERVWNGQLNIEDLAMGKASETARSKLVEQQQELYMLLRELLARQTVMALELLRNPYGIGSSVPSHFALDLISRTPFPEACPALMASVRASESDLMDDETASRIRAAAEALDCR